MAFTMRYEQHYERCADPILTTYHHQSDAQDHGVHTDGHDHNNRQTGWQRSIPTVMIFIPVDNCDCLRASYYSMLADFHEQIMSGLREYFGFQYNQFTEQPVFTSKHKQATGAYKMPSFRTECHQHYERCGMFLKTTTYESPESTQQVTVTNKDNNELEKANSPTTTKGYNKPGESRAYMYPSPPAQTSNPTCSDANHKALPSHLPILNMGRIFVSPDNCNWCIQILLQEAREQQEQENEQDWTQQRIEEAIDAIIANDNMDYTTTYTSADANQFEQKEDDPIFK
ncbi:hypothetical protein QBC47DRAFT_431859 [Echria macrotheca]|uniref:Uncharacterized protein n=1 Tax=Echria macrotheca TaxID=438768 RepID=A0AAJ0B8U6_9PEZI|nr:hypothetical protein QBC47DRAFT_431859 [Echria macrotheca]